MHYEKYEEIYFKESLKHNLKELTDRIHVIGVFQTGLIILNIIILFKVW